MPPLSAPDLRNRALAGDFPQSRISQHPLCLFSSIVSIRKLQVMAEKGRSWAFEEIVIQFQCKISKTGKAFETSKSSNR